MRIQFEIAMFWAAAGSMSGHNIVGDWQGVLKVKQAELRLAIHVGEGGDRQLEATMDSIDQGIKGIPISSITFEKGAVRFVIDVIRASYEGTLNADGSTIDGTFVQGQPLPLTFRRSAPNQAAASPANVTPSLATLVARLLPYGIANPSASPRMSRLLREVEARNTPAVDEFWREIAQTQAPLIEPIAEDPANLLVTFLWRGPAATRHVAVLGGVAGTDAAKNQLIHIAGTDVWYRSYRIRNDARFSYAISPNDSLEPFDQIDPNDVGALLRRVATLRADPLNPKRAQGQFPSYVELPGAVRTHLPPVAGAAKGERRQTKLASRVLQNERNVWVYTPPGFTAGAARYPLIVAFDGPLYTTLIDLPEILDTLIANKAIPPTVLAVLDNATPVSRNTELACSGLFSEFVTKEVVPWMRNNYGATLDKDRSVVAGASLGGLAAFCAAMHNPDVFGNVLSQSGAFWWVPGNPDAEPGWIMKELAGRNTHNLRVALQVGLMEADAVLGQSMLSTNRHLRDVLSAKAYALQYKEYNGGHDYLNWRANAAEALIFLLARQ